MIIRVTAKLRDALEVPIERVDRGAADETWYSNLVKISRWRWLLLMHEATLFPVVIPGVRAADLRRFPDLVCGRVEGALGDHGLPAAMLGELDPAAVSVAPTADRAMLGHLNQMKVEIEYAGLGASPEAVDVGALHRQLAETPRARGGSHVFAIDLLRERG